MSSGEPSVSRRSLSTRILLGLLVLFGIAAFIGLGFWQLQRRHWKLELIEQIEQRIHAAAQAAPGPVQWSRINARHDAYRRLWISGRFLNDRETLVHAASRLGMGYWVMTPLRTDAGFIILVNRGFVPMERSAASTRRAGLIEGATTVTGLLRVSEPTGSLLQSNEPRAGHWYSRDVAAIAQARSLASEGAVAPYFIDADATPVPGGCRWVV